MSALSTSLLNHENPLKLPIGPTISIPGPMLFMQDITAVTLVVKLKSSIETRSVDAIITITYATRYIETFLTSASF